MDSINRREFLGTAAATVATVLGGRALGADAPVASRPAAKILRASDTITLGKSGVKASRLAIGTGTKGGNVQRELGTDGMIKLLKHALDQGVRWWDGADMYKSHPYLGKALKEVKRDQVVLTSKTWAHTKDGSAKPAQEVRDDIERFRKELGTDYIDIVLLHCLTDPDWRNKMKGPMEVLSEAKAKGQIRAVGCSCHSFEALKAAADEPWVEVDLARFNPFAVIMDVRQPAEVPDVAKVLETMHQRGKGVYGMKIVGEGAFKSGRLDESLRFVLSKPFISGFTIGFGNQDEFDDVIRRIERIGAKA